MEEIKEEKKEEEKEPTWIDLYFGWIKNMLKKDKVNEIV